MQKTLTKKTTAKKAHADSRVLIAFIAASIKGAKVDLTISAAECSHALIDLDGDRFRILVEAL